MVKRGVSEGFVEGGEWLVAMVFAAKAEGSETNELTGCGYTCTTGSNKSHVEKSEIRRYGCIEFLGVKERS